MCVRFQTEDLNQYPSFVVIENLSSKKNVFVRLPGSKSNAKIIKFFTLLSANELALRYKSKTVFFGFPLRTVKVQRM